MATWVEGRGSLAWAVVVCALCAGCGDDSTGDGAGDLAEVNEGSAEGMELPQAADAGVAVDEAPAREDLGMGDGSDVVTIGDSWMNLVVTGIAQSLDNASGQNYRHYGVPGTRMLNEEIPGQYEQALGENADIKTVVATGGGNDILGSPCSGEECFPIVDDVVERIEELSVQFADDGVEDVVIIGYTYPSDQAKHASIDYMLDIADEFCNEQMSPRCHFVDSTQLDIQLIDGIHPTPAGYDLIAQTVWELMQEKGIRR